MSQAVLNFPSLAGWSLAGLGADENLSASQAFALMRPLIPPGSFVSISDDDLRSVISQIMNKYAVLKTNKSPQDAGAIEGEIRNIILTTLGAKAVAFKAELTNAFNALGNQGYKILEKSGASSAAPALTTIDSVVSNATTPGNGKEPAAVDTFNAAIDIVKQMAPGITAARQAEAAQKLLEKQKAGKQIYKKKNWTPWIIGGIGVLAVLGIVYVAVKR